MPNSRAISVVAFGCLFPCLGAMIDASLPTAQAGGSGPTCDSLCRKRNDFHGVNGAVGKPCYRYTFPTCMLCTGGATITACYPNQADSNTGGSCRFANQNNLMTAFSYCNDVCPPGTLQFVEADTLSGDADPAVQADIWDCV